jgi:hypothetical protein
VPSRGNGFQPVAEFHGRLSRHVVRRKWRGADRCRSDWVFRICQSIFRCASRTIFSRIIADLDEPFADPSSVPTWYLARETTRHVKVVLGGDGGDELFGGYKRYAKHLRTRWRRGLVLPSLQAPAGIGGKGWQRLSEELRLDWRSAYALRFSGLTPGERAFLAPQFRHGLTTGACRSETEPPISRHCWKSIA